MSQLSIKKQVTGNVEDICLKITESLKSIGFGVLTRIDFDKKINEKLNASLKPVVILGACNPRLAYEAYKESTDVALLIPCNIVVRELDHLKVEVEVMRPTKMLEFIPAITQKHLVQNAETDLEKLISNL